MLGIFLILDGRAPNLFPTVEFYAKTSTWGIVAAIPVLAVAYVLGLLLIGCSSLLFKAIPFVNSAGEITDLIKIGRTDNSAITKRYFQLLHDQEILSGSALALILLTAGALSEIRNLRRMKSLIIIMALAAFLVAIAVFFFAMAKANMAHEIVKAITKTN